MRNATEGRIVVRVLFLDGVTRDVYEDSDGRQWVIGYCLRAAAATARRSPRTYR
jgi:hypothetical protein